MSVTQLDSKIVYQNRWMRVREDVVARPDGSRGIYGVVEKPDYAVILPVDGDGLHLVEQYRYPVGGRFWELPQGSWEERPDVDPAVLARAELEEETGLAAAEMREIGRLFQAYGYSNQGFRVFVASGLTRTAQRLEVEEQDLVARRFGFAEVAAMIRDGRIRDATTVAALMLAKLTGAADLGL
jgi:8-oxo-dGTP pyrophosphatase MutT (NUDIX family)